MKSTVKQAAAVSVLMMAAGGASAQSSVNVYGQVRLTANDVKTGSASSVKELRDNASRLGFRGTEDLGGGLAAIFGLEMGFSADTGAFADSTAVYRHSYVALRSASLGTVALGRLDSANPTGSPLYSQVTALTSFAPNDAGATAIGTVILNSRNRVSNAVGYMSPEFYGFSVRARGYLRGGAVPNEAENAAKSVDLGLNYASGPIKLALGYGKDTRAGGLLNNEFQDKWQVGANYAFPWFELYGLAGRDRYKRTATSRDDVDYWLLGTRVPFGAHAVVLNVMQRDVQTSLTGERRRQQLAWVYALSKRTELQAFYDHDGVDSSRRNVKVRAVGAGIRHDF